MHYQSSNERKSANLHLRIDPQQKALIDRAAHVIGKNRSSFMIKAAYDAAEEILLNQTRFNLDVEQWAQFNEVLNTMPKSRELLQNLLETKAPWER